MADESLDREIEARVEALGYELVELERSGSKTRPILRLRIDKPADAVEAAVTVEDCTRVSRDVEAFLDAREEIGERYVLEVSSPGLERPLVKRRDFERFAGKEITVKTSHAVGDLGKRVEGVLKGIADDDRIQLEIKGATVAIPRDDIKKANLVFRWDGTKK
jgi:ribosome maturation factor RimP